MPSFSLRALFRILFKRKLVILVCFIAAVGVGLSAAYLSSKVYRSSAKLLVEVDPEKESAVQLNASLSRRNQEYDWIGSEMAIIKSFPVAAKVVESLDLYPAEASPTQAANPDAKLHAAVTSLRRKLDISNSKKSNIIEVAMESTDPNKATQIVRHVIESYVIYRSQISEQAETHSFFQEQLDLANDKLTAMERRQLDFKRDKAVLSPATQENILLTRLGEYESNLTKIKSQRISKEAKLSVIRQQLKRGQYLNIPSTEASDSPSREKYIAKLRGDLLDFEIQRDKLLQKYTPKYEEVVELDNLIKATQSRIGDEIKQLIEIEAASLRAMLAEEISLRTSIEKLKDEIRAFADDEYEYSQLSRGIDGTREVYSMLLKEREEARISLAKLERGVKIRVISPPVVPIDPVSPSKRLFVGAAIILGAFLGLGLAFTLELIDQSIDSPMDLANVSDLTPLGSIRAMDLSKLMTNKGANGARQTKKLEI